MVSRKLGYDAITTSYFSQDGEKIRSLIENNDIIVLPEGVAIVEIDSLVKSLKENNTLLVNGSHFEFGSTNNSNIIYNGVQHNIQKEILTIEEELMGILPKEQDKPKSVSIDVDGLIITCYICKDFIYDVIDTRSDIIIVVQDDDNIELFNNRAIEIVKGFKNFVIGCNTSGNESTIYGIGNKRITWYTENKGLKPIGSCHNTLYRKSMGEMEILTFELNVGVPFSFPFGYDKLGIKPIIKFN